MTEEQKALARQVADTIEVLPHSDSAEGFKAKWSFGMSEYTSPCGAPQCIAGWTCFIADGRIPKENPKIYLRAAELLGLAIPSPKELAIYGNKMTDCAAKQLFLPGCVTAHYTAFTPEHPRFISPARAAATLRHLAETGGEVSWAA